MTERDISVSSKTEIREIGIFGQNRMFSVNLTYNLPGIYENLNFGRKYTTTNTNAHGNTIKIHFEKVILNIHTQCRVEQAFLPILESREIRLIS